ncbi:hypothetical protein FRB99_000905 [Tulasnella sp. 403]|nr:hypothetical protein FRB99_000905 [Tulasnella sp. 403]
MDRGGNESKPYLRPKFKASLPPKEGGAATSTSPALDENQPSNTPAATPTRSKWWTRGATVFTHQPAARVSAWEASRLMDDGSILPPCAPRPWTRKNGVLAARLAPYTFLELAYTRDLLMPAWHEVMLARLLDCVQEAMSSSAPVDKAHIAQLVLWNLVAAHSEKLLKVFLRYNTRTASHKINECIELMYLKTQLVLDIPMLSDTKVASLLKEAQAFAGFDTSQRLLEQSPAEQLIKLTRLMRTVVSISSHSTVMLTRVMGTTRGSTSLSSFIFIFLSFLPSLLGLFTIMARNLTVFSGYLKRKAKREILQLGGNGQYKQEILLFGLADWVIGKWRGAHEFEKLQEEVFKEPKFTLGLILARDSVETLCYALIALGMFPPSVSISNMRLCQSCAKSLVYTVESLRRQIEDLLQFLFHGTAFLESQRLEETLLKPRGETIDYLSIVHPSGRRGMKIEARNLSFTYPGQSSPTLKDIDITIEPGETLAIVGFNGGGKTTLVKVLMGLYDYEGTLLINDRPASSYTRPSLHAHTTVCFQDYAKYDLTVKENVGTGNYLRIDDAKLMGDALKKGGADEIVSSFPKGVEEKLNSSRIPTGREETARSQAQGSVPPPQPGGAGPRPSTETPGPPPPGTNTGSLPEPVKVPSSFMSMRNMRRFFNEMDTHNSKGLSGGQWQRIALARAFMRSEQADLVVFETTIYVSHRFSTTRRADKIAVVEDGRIAELGSHDELMKLEGRYAELFNLQAKAFVD